MIKSMNNSLPEQITRSTTLSLFKSQLSYYSLLHNNTRVHLILANLAIMYPCICKIIIKKKIHAQKQLTTEPYLDIIL